MIYLISQVTFIFLTQIYYNMNFITLPSNFITRFFPGTLRSIFANCFWRTKIWKISCSLKTLLKILVFNNLFPNFSGNCILINFLTKTRKCLICWLLWIQNYQITGNYLTSNTTFPKKSNSYEISNTDIYIGEDLEFIIHVFYWCIQLDHEIY